jgi:hypothetical protein
MNIWKWILENVFNIREKFTRQVCAASGLLVNPHCPEAVTRRYYVRPRPGEPIAPTEVCNIHIPPSPKVFICTATGKRAVLMCPDSQLVPVEDAPPYYCRRHARTRRAGPAFVLAHVDIHCKLSRYTDAELETYARRIGEAGVDYVRVFFTGWDDGLRPCEFPFRKSSDLWDLDMPNQAYYDNLRRLAITLSRYEVGLYIDMADQCAWDEYWDCWRKNTLGIQGWHDESIAAFSAWRSAVDRIRLVLGGSLEGHIIGLGNEIRHPDEEHLPGSCDWPTAWGKLRCDYLVTESVRRPILHSAGGETGHKLQGCLSPEESSDFGWDYIAQVVHGYGLLEQVQQYFPYDVFQGKDRHGGYSDDGVDTADWNRIPPDKRGIGNKAGTNYPANNEERAKTIREFARILGDRLEIVEFLPRELSDDQSPGNLAEESVKIYPKVADEIWGKDIRRRF